MTHHTARDDTRPPALAFAAIVLAMLPAVLDQTILATALPTIALDLGRLADVSWVVSAYVIAAAATTPLWGKLGDRHERTRLLQIALALFVTASVASGFAQDMGVLIGLRAVQGAAAGGLMALAMACVGDLVPSGASWASPPPRPASSARLAAPSAPPASARSSPPASTAARAPPRSATPSDRCSWWRPSSPHSGA